MGVWAQPVFMRAPTPWADSVFKSLSLDQKIGQLFMVPAWSDPKHMYFNDKQVVEWITKYGVGGIIFFQGGPQNQLKCTQRYQDLSAVPLLIGMDAEWGLSMRLDSTILYPRQMTLGAITDLRIVKNYAAETAMQLKRLGVHFSFSPVVDVNNNPKNPVISNRSFGESRETVLRASQAFMEGLQENNILACAKHFPGHGDTDTDSHEDMPIIPFSKQRLDSLELYPYRPLFQNGLSSVMTGHLYVPAYEKRPGIPASLSDALIEGFLKKEMGFKGLVVTDALNMQGVAKHFKPGEMEVMAIQAGNDILLFPSNIPKAVEMIKLKLRSGELSMDRINESCYKILQSKEWCGLNSRVVLKKENVMEDLGNENALQVYEEVNAAALTLIQYDSIALRAWRDPLKKKALVIIGGDSTSQIVSSANILNNVDYHFWKRDVDVSWVDSAKVLLSLLNGYDQVGFAFVNTSSKASKNFGVSPIWLNWISKWENQKNKLLLLFANPYALGNEPEVLNFDIIATGYQDDDLTQHVLLEAIAGARYFSGKLPVSVGSFWKCGDGIELPKWNVLSKTVQSSDDQLRLIKSRNIVVMKNKEYVENMFQVEEKNNAFQYQYQWQSVDSLVNVGLGEGAFPGCRLLVAHKGEIVYDRAYGYLDENHTEKVQMGSVYDLASITKLAASGLAMMWMYDHGYWDLESTLGESLSFPRKSPYAKVKWRDLLSHQAGLKSFIPFATVLNSTAWHKDRRSEVDRIVADSLFADSCIVWAIRKKIIETPLKIPAHYEYSDLGYFFVKEFVENKTGKNWSDFMNENFYHPMGLNTMGYLPLGRLEREQIAPTENDTVFRHQLIRGYVHDETAALMGGVAGHAGLFSDAYDLAVILQMLTKKGNYRGQQFIKPETVDLFNKRHIVGNRRGLVLDKPPLNQSSGGSASALVSDSSFGHTGFTGTMGWADPEHDLVFVFLSNRIHPSVENKKLIQGNYRTKIQTEVYRQLFH
ncbi:MAG: hypothetical protein RLZZ205_242 [Bacteroidota bacterium]|jgi:beta-glucosidase-like glycosyl hydrolase/CubicO group peptidase (beta-lactamase class C family)